MKRAVARTGTKDLEEIIDRYEGRIFGFASKNFYAEFLAAREVASSPEIYFGAAPRWPLLQYQELRLDRAVLVPDLLRALQLSICDLTHYNPALRPPVLAGEKPLPLGYRLKLPAGSQPAGASLSALIDESVRPELRVAGGPRPPKSAASAGQEAGATARSKVSPDPLPAWIASLTLPPGPGPASRAASFLFDSALLWAHPGGKGPAPRPASAPGSLGSPRGPSLTALRITDGKIQVEPEENLALVASWLNVPASRLRQLNGLRPGQSLRLGQWLQADFSRVGEEEFSASRVRYQRDLAAGFLRANRVTSTRLHEVRPGETLWSIARRNGRLPLWLLRWYNDGPSWLEPAPGAQVVVPVVERLAS
jgi:membrane-bound lytic murein transglycosylase D